ncbi:DUF2795 domain-containing protein [Halobacteriales archaeon SW_7_68_16]|nr:MAG: DUF2795 domain-containing protein [Halobacteriales archaeon SW_7_68_16]
MDSPGDHHGLALGELYRRLTGIPYPVSRSEVVTAVGDHELNSAGGTERVGEVLNRIEVTEFRDPAEVVTTLLTGVSAEAIGRRGYSDRDPPQAGEQRTDVSF